MVLKWNECAEVWVFQMFVDPKLQASQEDFVFFGMMIR